MKNQNSFKLNKLYALLVLLSSQNVFAAANFTIAPYGTLPTTVTTGQSVSANFTLTNMTNLARNGYTVQGLPATVSQNTTSPNCTNPINLGPNASCQLQLDITGAVSSKVAICKGSSCTTATAPLNVSVNSTPAPTAPRFAYVSQDQTPNILVCVVNPDSGLLSGCTNADVTSSLGDVYAQGISVNSAGTVAYIAGGTESAYTYQCPINHSTGLFSSGCTTTNITSPTGYYPYYGMMSLSPDNHYAYLSDYEDGYGLRILSCPIVNNVISGTCLSNGPITGAASGSYGAGVAVNQANTVGYASLYDQSLLSVCSISSYTWSATCQNVAGDGTITFSEPGGIAFNSDGSILYVSSADKKVYGCNPSIVSGNFSHCFTAIANIFPSGYVWGIAINAQNSFAYITDYSNTVKVCGINHDGTFGSCVDNTSFSSPTDIALLY